MKVHYNSSTYGVTCNTNRTRTTTHRNRVTDDKSKVTCSVCRKMHGLDRDTVRQTVK